MFNEKEKEKRKFAIAAYCNDLCHKLVVGHVTLYLSKVNRLRSTKIWFSI